jgi:hypothetical protein
VRLVLPAVLLLFSLPLIPHPHAQIRGFSPSTRRVDTRNVSAQWTSPHAAVDSRWTIDFRSETEECHAEKRRDNNNDKKRNHLPPARHFHSISCYNQSTITTLAVVFDIDNSNIPSSLPFSTPLGPLHTFRSTP